MKEEVRSKDAPEAIGPYSQGVKAGKMVFLSGQIPIDPLTNSVVEGGVGEQTRRVLENLKAVLASTGCGLDDVVKTTVFLKEMASFGDMNGVYAEFFSPPFPARATVEVSELPKGVAVEIDAIAVARD